MDVMIPSAPTKASTVNAKLSRATSEGLERRPLRFITCGSVDDGKSTLIGRLLYDSKALMIDQIDTLKKQTKSSVAADTGNGKIDLSLVTDGLEAEREQGITIDVAYRYFTTPRRKFIIADAPGHEQYTRNMVTGASKSDVAVILIDVTKLDFDQAKITLLPQTKRHAAIAGILRLQHIVVAVNKMDAIDFSKEKFERVVAAFNEIAASLQLPPHEAIPISALDGDGVVNHSARTAWFQGPSLLAHLETLSLDEADTTGESKASYLAVQFVNRDANDDHLRWYMGDVSDAPIAVGDHITALPSGAYAVVAKLHTARGEQTIAKRGEAVAVLLDRQVDVARGDWLVASKSAAETKHAVTRRCSATIAWLDTAPLNVGRRLLAKHGTRWVPVRVTQLGERLNLSTALWEAQPDNGDADGGSPAAVKANDLVHVEIAFASDLPLTSFGLSTSRGAFALVDPSTNATAAAAIIH
jgi:sulfate adenylyltransferase subunit 1